MGVDIGKLPRIVASTDIVGEVSRQAAAETGLAPGTPIAAGCGDQSAGFVGAGILREGQMVDVSGTACILGAGVRRLPLRHPAPDPGLHEGGHRRAATT